MSKTFFHTTATANRDSILDHGLDVTRMGRPTGIAGSPTPEQDGVQLVTHLDEAWWYATFPSHTEIDIWGVDMEGLELEETSEGWIARSPIPPDRLTLLVAAVSPEEARTRLQSATNDSAPQGEITVHLRTTEREGL
jgi:hypothetical protein